MSGTRIPVCTEVLLMLYVLRAVNAINMAYVAIVVAGPKMVPTQLQKVSPPSPVCSQSILTATPRGETCVRTDLNSTTCSWGIGHVHRQQPARHLGGRCGASKRRVHSNHRSVYHTVL